MTGELRPCGAYAEHVDHVLPRIAWPSSWRSSLTAAGSTRRWRRLRLYVLDRDGWRCQLLVDEHGQLVEQPAPEQVPAGVDDPANLRAACQLHNLQRGAGRAAGNTRQATTTGRPAGRWEW